MTVCLFDIDGTLLSSGGAGKAAIETALVEEFSVTIQGQVPYSGRTDRAIARDLFHAHGLTDNPVNWDRLREGYLRRLPGCLTRHRGQVLPGIAQVLQLLNEMGTVAVGLLTGNIRAGARLKLGHFGLEHHFAFGGFGDHHLDRNDVAREALGAVHQHLNGAVIHEQIWVVGDTPLDIRCARFIGVRVAAVATGFHPLEELAAEKPDLLLENLSDPGPFLESLEKRNATNCQLPGNPI